MKILITGGTGFFGKALLKYWIKSENKNILSSKIVLISRNPKNYDTFINPFRDFFDLELIYGDVEDFSSLKKDDYTHVLHAAADSTYGPYLSLLAQYKQIVNGTKNILDLSVECGVTKFLFASSGAVYGEISQFVDGVKEEYIGAPDPLSPLNTYGIAKRNAEHLCAVYHHQFGLKYSIARCFAFIGEDLPLNAHFAIGNFISDALNGRDILIRGNGKQIRTYLYQSELAKWLTTILLDQKDFSVYNVGSDEKISLKNTASLISKYVSENKSKVIIQNYDNNSFRNFYVPNIDLINKELGLKVEINLIEAIKNVRNLKLQIKDY